MYVLTKQQNKIKSNKQENPQKKKTHTLCLSFKTVFLWWLTIPDLE